MKRNNYVKLLISSILYLVFLTSCDYYNKYREHQNIESIIKSWVGEKIYLPNSIINKTSECSRNNHNSIVDKKMVVYIDTTECTECKLRLQEWKLKIKEMKESVRFIFIVNPRDYDIAKSIFCREKLESMLFLDTNNEFRNKNKLLSDKKYLITLLYGVVLLKI